MPKKTKDISISQSIIKDDDGTHNFYINLDNLTVRIKEEDLRKLFVEIAKTGAVNSVLKRYSDKKIKEYFSSKNK